MADIATAKQEEFDLLETIDPSLEQDAIRRESLASSLENGNVWLARKETDPVGFIQLHRHFYGNWFIELLFIRADARRQGIGQSLLNIVVKETNDTKLFTSTNQSNTPMRELLLANDFVQSGHIENLDPGDPEIVYLHFPHVA